MPKVGHPITAIANDVNWDLACDMHSYNKINYAANSITVFTGNIQNQNISVKRIMGMIIGFNMISHSSYNYIYGLKVIVHVWTEIGYYFITCLLCFRVSSS